jgi:hypothetical protein
MIINKKQSNYIERFNKINDLKKIPLQTLKWPIVHIVGHTQKIPSGFLYTHGPQQFPPYLTGILD